MWPRFARSTQLNKLREYRPAPLFAVMTGVIDDLREPA